MKRKVKPRRKARPPKRRPQRPLHVKRVREGWYRVTCQLHACRWFREALTGEQAEEYGQQHLRGEHHADQ